MIQSQRTTASGGETTCVKQGDKAEDLARVRCLTHGCNASGERWLGMVGSTIRTTKVYLSDIDEMLSGVEIVRHWGAGRGWRRKEEETETEGEDGRVKTREKRGQARNVTTDIGQTLEEASPQPDSARSQQRRLPPT